MAFDGITWDDMGFMGLSGGLPANEGRSWTKCLFFHGKMMTNQVEADPIKDVPWWVY